MKPTPITPAPRHLLRKFTLTTIGVIVVAGGLILTKLSQFKAMGAAAASQAMPPEVVTAMQAREDTWQDTVGATGSVAAVQGVTVGAEMAGKVVKIAFESGQAVKAGDLLVQLDTSTEEAQLRAAEATAALANANLQRAKELRANNTNSPAELDAANAQAKQAAAQADNIRAVIAKKTIRAPFAGRLGLRMVNLGQILKEGDAITSLETLDPIYVNFSLPQQRISELHVGATVHVRSDAAPGKTFDGKITALNAEVDPTTRNIRVQATLPNTDEKLRPGMFANVDVVLPSETKVLAIPATAIQYAPYGDTVFVIDEKKGADGKAEQVLRLQVVQLGGARGDFVAVRDGLKPGEQIVTSGVFKLRPGMNVVVDNTLAPPVSLNPKPKDA